VRRIENGSTELNNRRQPSQVPYGESGFRTEAVAPILNKAGEFATSPNVRAIIGQNGAEHARRAASVQSMAKPRRF
jgi:hypothetical protein